MKKLIPLTVLLSVAAMNIFAQDDAANKKLKDAQVSNVLAPAKVKIDGNLTEWDNNFQAYNKSTKLFYTMSNDDKYLYLIVKSTDANNNTKITAGGITLTINTDGKKKEEDGYSITYPVIARPTFGQRGQRGAGGGQGIQGFGQGGQGFGRGNAPDSATLAAARKQLVTSSKEIKVSGFKDITDSLISIYNEHSIKTAISYEGQNNYSYEVAIPIKLLGLSTDNTKEFAYNVKVNGRQLPNFNQQRIDNAGGGQGGAGGFGGGAGGFGGAGGGRGGAGGGQRGGFTPGGRGPGGNIDIAELTTPSDFWGKYTLAKK